MWSARRWGAAIVGALVTALAVGIPTDVIPNPVFGRPVDVTWWSYPVLVLTAVLAGLLIATYVRDDDGLVSPGLDEQLDRPGTTGGIGGLLSFFAVGCPTCNKLAVVALGSTGALDWFAPHNPLWRSCRSSCSVGRCGRVCAARPPAGLRRDPLPAGNMGRMTAQVSEIFDPSAWTEVAGFDFTDITYHRANDVPAVRIAFDRPEIRNAFRPHTVDELYTALDHARMSSDIGCVLLTGNGPSPKDGGWAFCSGGDQRIRGKDGYRYADGETADSIDPARSGRLHILECQRLIRFMPKVVICVVPGWAAGGGHSLHVTCDLTLAERGARPLQADRFRRGELRRRLRIRLPRTVRGSEVRPRDLLPRPRDTARQMHEMGGVNQVVPHAELEATALQWAREICSKSPTAQRMLKYTFNLIDDGLVGQQIFAGEATRLAYGTDEAAEGRDSFLEKRTPNWDAFPYYY